MCCVHLSCTPFAYTFHVHQLADIISQRVHVAFVEYTQLEQMVCYYWCKYLVLPFFIGV